MLRQNTDLSALTLLRKLYADCMFNNSCYNCKANICSNGGASTAITQLHCHVPHSVNLSPYVQCLAHATASLAVTWHFCACMFAVSCKHVSMSNCRQMHLVGTTPLLCNTKCIFGSRHQYRNRNDSFYIFCTGVPIQGHPEVGMEQSLQLHPS